jgi:hypothetical protein
VEVAAVSDYDDLPLFAPRPRARRRDPLSSRLAGEKAERFINEHAITVLKLILDNPMRTAKELAALPKATLDYWQISRRLGELAEHEWIERVPDPRTKELRCIAKTKASDYFGVPNPSSGSWQEHPGPGEKIRDARLT